MTIDRNTKIHALELNAQRISRLIVSSDIMPLDGARMIWDSVIDADLSDLRTLDGFIYAASEMPDRPEDEDFFIRQSSKKLRS